MTDHIIAIIYFAIGLALAVLAMITNPYQYRPPDKINHSWIDYPVFILLLVAWPIVIALIMLAGRNQEYSDRWSLRFQGKRFHFIITLHLCSLCLGLRFMAHEATNLIIFLPFVDLHLCVYGKRSNLIEPEYGGYPSVGLDDEEVKVFAKLLTDLEFYNDDFIKSSSDLCALCRSRPHKEDCAVCAAFWLMDRLPKTARPA